MKHWKTSSIGLALAITLYITGHPAEFQPQVVAIASTLSSLLTLALGWFAADAKGDKPA